MVSLSRKKDQREKFGVDNVSFFISILEESYLKVPTSYVKKYLEKYGEELSKVVYLKPPCGTEWEVQVTGHNGHFWFETGWETFFKFYRLQKRDKLTFQYEGNSRFKVHIFDRLTQSEIDYPREDPPPLPQTKKEATPSGDGGKSSTTQISQKPITEVPMGMQSLATGGKATAPQITKEFKSRSFSVTMCSSYVKKGYLWLPKTFVQTYLSKQPSNATLTVLGEKKTWPVKLIRAETEGRVKFQYGWSNFVRDKKLKVGDVCEFVLVDTDRLVFEVKIPTANHTLSPDIDDGDHEDDEHEYEDLNHFPRHLKRREKSPLASLLHKKTRPTYITQKFTEGRLEVPRKMHHPDTARSGKDIALERANPYPAFKVSIRPSYIHGCYLLVPAKFAKRYLVEQPSHAILQVAGKRPCSVNFHYAAGKTTFQRGWFEFVEDNKLKEGDACVFKLTDNIMFLFDVVFFRST